jgi:hypothetical protein
MIKRIKLSIQTCLFLILLSACSLGSKTTPTPDIQATVNAAIKTSVPNVTQPNLQSTVDAAVQATSSANNSVQATVGVSIQQTAGSITTILPTVTPLPPTGNSYYTTLSEEQLTAIIDQAVAEAQKSSQQTSTATTQATSNGTVSDGEIQTVQMYVTATGQAVQNAEQLIAEYQQLYGDYASEYLDVLTQMEADLNSISQSMAQITKILDQGSQAATQAISQLNEAVQTMNDKASELQSKAQGTQQKFQSEMAHRTDELKNLKPKQVAGDKAGAIQQTFTFLDALKGGLSGGKIGKQQSMQIAQLGVDASASLKAQGGPQLQHFSGNVDKLNAQMIQGQYPQAKKDLNTFEKDFQGSAKKPGRK